MIARTHQRRRLRATLAGTGTILLLGAGVMLVSAVGGLAYREWWAGLWFTLSAVGTAAIGQAARRLAPATTDFDLQDALTTAGAGWAAMALLGAVPFVLAAHLTPDGVVAGYLPAGADYQTSSLLNFRRPLHAVFESMSGWTTTGLTMAVHEPSLPNAFLLYRSLMQWIGGAGIIVLAPTVFHQHAGVQGLFLYQAEGRRERLRSSIVSRNLSPGLCTRGSAGLTVARVEEK